MIDPIAGGPKDPAEMAAAAERSDLELAAEVIRFMELRAEKGDAEAAGWLQEQADAVSNVKRRLAASRARGT